MRWYRYVLDAQGLCNVVGGEDGAPTVAHALERLLDDLTKAILDVWCQRLGCVIANASDVKAVGD